MYRYLIILLSIFISACQRNDNNTSNDESAGGIFYSGIYVQNNTTNNFEDAQNYLIQVPKNEGCQSYDLFSYSKNFDVCFLDDDGRWHSVDGSYCDWLILDIQEDIREAYIEDNSWGRRNGFARTLTIKRTPNVTSTLRIATLLVTSSYEGIVYGAELTIEQDYK